MLSLVVRTILHFRNLLLPVVLGVSVAGAVIVGALMVGDSVRGSLRHMALDRIGGYDRMLISPRWFEPSIFDRGQFRGEVEEVLFLPQATALREQWNGSDRTIFRANDMALLGTEPSFWKHGKGQSVQQPQDEEIILNESLARTLQAKIGDPITLRVPAQSVVPAESALGKREQDTFVLPRWKVIDILPDESLARFSIRSDQRPVMNAFVDKKQLQQAIEVGSKINAILATNDPSVPSKADLVSCLRPTLNDLGLSFERVTRTFPNDDGERVYDYTHLTTDQMLLPDHLADRVMKEVSELKPAPVLTYLANGVERESGSIDATKRKSVPYSTISAVPWELLEEILVSTVPPVTIDKDAADRSDWIVVHRWLADELGIRVGDQLKIDYFLPETVEGTEVEKSFTASVIAIAPITSPDAAPRGRGRSKQVQYSSRPTPFNDPAWTPVVPGITDQDSISKWDTPFPLKREIEPQDDDYWNAHGLTPKLFISYERGKELFGSRFGNQTSLRFDHLSDVQREETGKKLTRIASSELPALGWRELALREIQLQKSSGTTPFDALFLSLSFFLIAAALLLVVLLFRLSIEKRADHWGLLTATGWTRGSVRKLLLLEGAILAGLGALGGVALGTLYAMAMIGLLKTWWVGAITVSFLDYYVRPMSLLLGMALSWLVALAAIYLSTRRLKKSPIASLLKGRVDEARLEMKSSRWTQVGMILSVFMAILPLGAGGFLQGQQRAGAFVVSGMLFMMAGLMWVWRNLKLTNSQWSSFPTSIDLARSNAKRSPTRSILSIALVAIASFLILSMSLFQAVPSDPGMGGFQWMGKSASPVYVEIGNHVSRQQAIGDAALSMKDWEVVSLRVRGGDDASCNNLYQANEPQILGMSPRIAKIDRDASGRSRFAWFQHKDLGSDESPWSHLEAVRAGDATSPIPVVIDQNTALWALHLGGYVGERFQYAFDGRTIHFEAVGILQNTILQGSLIIGEANFQSLFPSSTGYKNFLVEEKPSGTGADGKRLLENAFEEQGLSLVRSADVLSQLLAVQNTYLSAFQLLGALGLLLGTIGLGVAQLRGAMERRAELASMRAIGFTKSRLTWLLTVENVWQLLRGMLVGGLAAALATIPALLGGQPFAGLQGPLWMLSFIVITGLLTSWVSAKLAMGWPLLNALRSER
jgi:ABC-type lipoprotein release transport system permease subunit